MNNPPEWLLSTFMGILPILSVLAMLEIVVIVTFAILGYIYQKRSVTQQLGKRTMQIGLILALIALVGFFYPKLTSDLLTFNMLGRFLFPILFYSVAVWWGWRLYKLLKRNSH